MEYGFKEYKKSELLKGHLNVGGTDDKGNRIDVTNLYFTRNDVPCIDVMGEFHFARCNRENWNETLCKMKAGGVTIVASYLFWNYHEEIEGEFDFSGDLDVRAFILECQKVGLDVITKLLERTHSSLIAKNQQAIIRNSLRAKTVMHHLLSSTQKELLNYSLSLKQTLKNVMNT